MVSDAGAKCFQSEKKLVSNYQNYLNQGRNELYGIRVHSAGIWDHKPWDQDQ